MAKITLYEHDNYGGRSIGLDSDVPDLRALNFNDITSSVAVTEPNYAAVLFSDINYGLPLLLIPKDQSTLTNIKVVLKKKYWWEPWWMPATYKLTNWNDVASSVKIIGIPAPDFSFAWLPDIKFPGDIYELRGGIINNGGDGPVSLFHNDSKIWEGTIKEGEVHDFSFPFTMPDLSLKHRLTLRGYNEIEEIWVETAVRELTINVEPPKFIFGEINFPAITAAGEHYFPTCPIKNIGSPGKGELYVNAAKIWEGTINRDASESLGLDLIMPFDDIIHTLLLKCPLPDPPIEPLLPPPPEIGPAHTPLVEPPPPTAEVPWMVVEEYFSEPAIPGFSGPPGSLLPITEGARFGARLRLRHRYLGGRFTYHSGIHIGGGEYEIAAVSFDLPTTEDWKEYTVLALSENGTGPFRNRMGLSLGTRLGTNNVIYDAAGKVLKSDTAADCYLLGGKPTTPKFNVGETVIYIYTGQVGRITAREWYYEGAYWIYYIPEIRPEPIAEVWLAPHEEAQPGDIAIVYEHINYGGQSQGFGLGGCYDLSREAIGDNRISSVKVAPGHSVTLYENINYGGDYPLTIPSSGPIYGNVPNEVPDLRLYYVQTPPWYRVWNDQASSLKVS